MKHQRLLAGAAIVLLAASQAAYAQTGIGARPPVSPVGAAIGTDLDETVDDLELRTQRELARAEDQARFGTAAVPPGLGGSFSLTGVATWGNTDTVDVGAAGRITLGMAPINHSFGFAIEYGESEGERERNRLLGIYDGTYDFTPQLYGFGLVRGQYDEFAALNERDVFVGAGPGFRVINQENVAWRVQAGPGFRHTRNIETGDTSNDFAGIASSRFFYRISDDVFVTNDTDVIYSDVDTLVSNELALNTRLTGPLSARVGLRTDYTTDPAFDADLGTTRRSTDNRLTLGVVYSFN